MKKENGMWHIQENWVLKYVWGWNLVRFFFHKTPPQTKFSPSYPKTLCLLFWGTLLTPVTVTIEAFLLLVLWLLMLFMYIITAFFGYYPNLKSEREIFFTHKHWGSIKIPIAAWEVCAVILAVYLVVNHGPQFIAFVVNHGPQFIAFVANFIASSIITGIAAIIGILVFLFKTATGKAFREFVVATKRKMCLLIVVDIADKKEE